MAHSHTHNTACSSQVHGGGTQGGEVYALVAEFADVDSVYSAAEKVRDAKFSQWDVHTPFPVHGMDKAMGVRPTILPWITLAHGVAGFLAGLMLVWWSNATSFSLPGLWPNLQGYPYLISGKPTFSFPANIPIIFETTVLFSALGTVAGMFALNKLPMHSNPLLTSDRFRRVTSDRFFIVIEASDPQFNLAKTTAFLQSLNPTHIEQIPPT